ncbi:MAG: FtsQ-type POTRA domain-containing protein [Clostridia bacterium]|nr:FtsQ-type POTRA domain-containing protein [Clostridia bacterium]
MQGPGENDQRKPARAGERRSAGSDFPDWQKNTWYGPAPQNENPFDEPEDAPELRSSRSENVNEHLGDFWRAETSGRGYAPASQDTKKEETQSGEQKPARRRSGKNGRKIAIRVLLTAVILIVAAALVLRFAVFAVRGITVDGNRMLSAEEVIRSSGIRLGDNILTLYEAAVEKKIAEDYRLQFRYLEKKLPNVVTIGVKEREACCWLTYCGIHYTMDKNRMVLSETEKMTQTDERTGATSLLPEFQQLVEVKGLQIRSGCYIGQTMFLSSTRQQLLFSNLFLEMKVLSCTGEIREADLSNPDSVLLTTRDGYMVAMGDSSRIHEKLRSLLLVRQELIRMGETGGTINVATPESPLYSPPSGGTQ